MKNKQKKNYLDLIPRKNSAYTLDRHSSLVILHMTHTSFFHRLTQKFFNRSPLSYIKLDVYGSFLWHHINGRRTIGEIASCLKEHFGEEVEPLYNRLVYYMQILYNNHFIQWVQPNTPKNVEKE
jgi:hypothetical protein